MSSAADYIRAELAAGRLTAEHVEELVRDYQRAHGLTVDGKPGPATRGELDTAIALRSGPRPFPTNRAWPLKVLPDGRRPTITSGHFLRNPDRKNHNGVDLFYRYVPGSDPNTKVGDGGRTSNDKWWIPDDTMAIAAVPGVVELAGNSRTGWRVWIDAGDGWHVGYFHLTRIEVKPGDRVELGDPIGIVGDNPVDTDARHLHFEIYYGDLATYPRGTRDPQPILEAAPLLT